VGYFFVLCAVGANALSYYYPSPSYIPSFALMAAWTVVLFFAVFLHRALFHARTILNKYWSVSVDVRRGASEERVPLIKSVEVEHSGPLSNVNTEQI